MELHGGYIDDADLSSDEDTYTGTPPPYHASVEGVLFEGDARNRWRDGPVCPAVDKELWRLGPDGSGVFWRVMRQ
ncbi:hypothetical protein TNCV_4413831 [Trichonephila clavipes]|uniref:Uncharacterized protein n=1 Tax=Trichonephila clavipes TaxID=2585209 RepID=A0A8X6VFM0_TRICX|nr:hypothetical protein TNCV_4413831 [Trichonephila clavipes]